MYKKILVPVDLADTDLAKPALTTAVTMARASGGSVRLVNVLAMTPVMLAEYVPPDLTSSNARPLRRRSASLRTNAVSTPRTFRRLCAKAGSITRSSRRRKRSTQI